MSGTIEDIAKKWLAEPAYNKVLFFILFWTHYKLEETISHICIIIEPHVNSTFITGYTLFNSFMIQLQ